jgi:hypothetical protein
MTACDNDSSKQDWIPEKSETYYIYDLAEDLIQTRIWRDSDNDMFLLIEKLAFKSEGEARDALSKLLDGGKK